MSLRDKSAVHKNLLSILRRYSYWISLGSIIGITLFYIFSYPVLVKVFGTMAAIFIAISVILSGWFYGVRGGVIASCLSIVINLVLSKYQIGANDWSWNVYYGDIVASCFLLGIGLLVGQLRQSVKEHAQAESQLRSREKYLALTNEIAQTILSEQGLDSILKTLVGIVIRLFDADDCYITRWDSMRERVIPVITSANLERPYEDIQFDSNYQTMTASVLKAERVLYAIDVLNSPFIGPSVASQFPMTSIMGVPLIVGQHKLGALVIAFNEPHEFSLDELERAERTGAQIALALWNVQQDEKLARQLKETDALVKIGRALSKTERTGTNTVLQLIVDSARELISHAEQSVIHLLDKEENVLTSYAASGFTDRRNKNSRIKMPLGAGVAGQVIQKGVAINVPDVNADPRFLRDTPPPFRSLLVAPIQSGDEQIGTISVQSNMPDAFSSEDVELLIALGFHAALAIENTQLYEMTQKRLKEVNVLYRLSRDMGISIDPKYIFKEIVEQLQRNFDYYNVQLFILNSLNQDVIDFHGFGHVKERNEKLHRQLSPDESIAGHVARIGEPFITNNVEQFPFFHRDPDSSLTQSELAVPIKIEDQVVGVLDIQHAPPHKLTESDFLLITAIANQLATTLHEANLYTNLQEALQQEQAMRSQLLQSERLALVGRLLASVSHELNNPLQAIQNALFLLRDEIKLSTQGQQDMDIILAETERMSTLIERLRVIYKPAREKDFQALQFNNLVEDIYILISAHMRRKEVSFEFHPDPNLPLIPGIQDQLKQVLLNLFLNAIEAMPPRGHLYVQTEALAEENEIMVTIKDTGPGIDPELLPNIFNPFVTNKDTGTGLGLTISHDIIHQHAGRIEARNNPEGGAVFTMWLPVEAKEFS